MKTQPFCSSLAAMPNVCVYCGLGINANADPWTQTVWVLWGDPFAEGSEHWAPLHMVCSHRLDDDAELDRANKYRHKTTNTKHTSKRMY